MKKCWHGLRENNISHTLYMPPGRIPSPNLKTFWRKKIRFLPSWMLTSVALLWEHEVLVPLHREACHPYQTSDPWETGIHACTKCPLEHTSAPLYVLPYWTNQEGLVTPLIDVPTHQTTFCHEVKVCEAMRLSEKNAWHLAAFLCRNENITPSKIRSPPSLRSTPKM